MLTFYDLAHRKNQPLLYKHYCIVTDFNKQSMVANDIIIHIHLKKNPSSSFHCIILLTRATKTKQNTTEKKDE